MNNNYNNKYNKEERRNNDGQGKKKNYIATRKIQFIKEICLHQWQLRI